MSNPAEYRKGRKILYPQKPPKKCGRKKRRLFGRVTCLFDYFVKGKSTEMKVCYLLRFPRYLRAPSEERKVYFSQTDAALYWEVRNFTGFYDDLFLTQDLSYWDEWETILEKSGNLRNITCLHDMFIYECLRIHLGIEHYSKFWRILSIFNPTAIFPLLNCLNFVPTVQDFSDFYHNTPLDVFKEYFFSLVRQLVNRRIITYRILIWDCQFVHSNSSDYKSSKSKFYSDKDARLGRHNNKFLGIGYMASTLYAFCGDIIAPVFCLHFLANVNDKKIFYETMIYFFILVKQPVKVVLGDRGTYSIKNLQLLAQHGVIGMIGATKNIKKHNIVKLENNVLINRDFVPSSWSNDDLHKLYDIRTSIEHQFSHNTLVYNARRVNVRGIADIGKYRYMILCLDLLKIIACHKLGRGDLFQHHTAFSQMRGGYIAHMLRMTFESQGYKLLKQEPHSKIRQKQK
ncbi:hypothetical protein [Candidatus Harpocratesius sp.]